MTPHETVRLSQDHAACNKTLFGPTEEEEEDLFAK